MSANAIKAGAAFVEISARDEKFKRDLEANRRRVQSFIRTVAIVGAVAIASAAMSGVKAASTLEETMNKFNVVFGENRAAMKAWGDEFAEQVGRSQRQVADFLASTQDLLVPAGIDPEAAEQMSKDLTRLAVDVASFNNKLDSDVLRDFHAALTGGGETVKKYGVILNVAAVNQELLNQGIDPSAATEQEKVYARFQILLKGTVAAQGDAIRSGDSYANQLKRLQGQLENVAGEFGNALLPVATKLLMVLNDLAGPTAEFLANNQELVQVVVAVVGALSAAVIAFQAIAAAQSIVISKQVVLTALAGPAGWAALAVAVGVTGAAYYKLSEASTVAVDSLGNVGDALGEVEAETKRATQSLEELADRKLSAARAELAHAEAMRDATEETRQAAIESAKLSIKVAELFNQREEVQIARQFEGAFRRVNRAISEVTKLQDQQKTSAERLAEQLQKIAELREAALNFQRQGAQLPEGFVSPDEQDNLRRRLINNATGIDSEVQKVRDEIGLLNGTLSETQIRIRDMVENGLPLQEAREFRRLLEIRDQAKVFAEQRKELQRANEELARRQESIEQAQESRKTEILEQQRPATEQKELVDLFRDLRELVSENRLSADKAEEILFDRIADAQKAVRARQEQQARSVRQESSADLRTSAGAGLIVDALNGRVRVEERIERNTQQAAERLKEIVDQEDREAEV